jgi:hypothetical protein
MLFLHIGFHKAGSTTLQTFLRDNASVLATVGVDYPEIGRDPDAIAHHVLAKGLKKRRDPPEGLEAMWRELAALAGQGRTVVVSSEGLEPADPEPLREWLAGTPVKVVVYVRDLPSRLVSIYAQSIKRGNSTLDFDAFTARELALDRTRSAPKLKAWADVFGPENVRVRSVHGSVLAGGDVVTDFLDAVGLGPDAIARHGLVQPVSRNVSPGWKTLEVLRALNAEGGWSAEEDEASDARSPAGSLLRAAQEAAARLGWSDRGLYLDAAQIAEAVRVDGADSAAVEALGLDARLVPAQEETFEARTFMPEVSRIAQGELTGFYREMVLSMGRQIMLRPRRRR